MKNTKLFSLEIRDLHLLLWRPSQQPLMGHKGDFVWLRAQISLVLCWFCFEVIFGESILIFVLSLLEHGMMAVSRLAISEPYQLPIKDCKLWTAQILSLYSVCSVLHSYLKVSWLCLDFSFQKQLHIQRWYVVIIFTGSSKLQIVKRHLKCKPNQSPGLRK